MGDPYISHSSYSMKAIEAEVNIHYTDLLDGDGTSQYQFLLVRQLMKIQV